MARLSPFLGRTAELAKLKRAFTEAAGGQGSFVLLEGEAGIGKSRLAHEFLDSLSGSDAILANGRFYEALETTPYVALREAILTLLETPAVRSRVDASSPHIGAIPALGSEFAVALGLNAPARGTDAAPDQYRLWRGMTELVATACNISPTVIFLDDLHWADSSSRDFIRFMTDRARSQRLLLVMTVREDEGSREQDGTPSRAFAQPLTHIRLGGLAKPEVAAMATGLAERDVAAALVDNVYEQSGGNPLIVEELMRLALDALPGLPTVPEGPALAVPENIRDLMIRRLSNLSSGCHDLLEVMAVIGRETGVSLLFSVSGGDRPAVLNALDEAVLKSIATEISTGKFGFHHPLMRTVIYQTMKPSRRLTTHLRVAQAVLDERGTGVGPHAVEIARHTVAARELADPLDVIARCLTGARQSRLLFSFGDGRDLLLEALEAAERLPSDNSLVRAEVLTELGYAENGLGHPTEALKLYREALAEYKRSNNLDGATDVRRWMVGTLLQHGRPSEAIEISRDGLLEAREERADRYHGLVAGHAFALMFNGAIAEAGPWVDKAIELAFDDVTTANANHLAGAWHAWGAGNRLESSPSFVRARGSLLDGGWESTAAGIAGDHMVAAYFLGEFEQSAESESEAERLAINSGRSATLSDLHAFRSLRYVQRGEWENADNERVAWRSATDALGSETVYGQIARRGAALTEFWRCGPGAVRGLLDTGFALNLPLLPLLAAESGDHDAAQTGVTIMRQTVPVSGRGLLWLGATLPLVATMCTLRDDGVSDWHDSLLEYRGALFDWFLVDLELARICAYRSLWEEAEAHFSDAAELATTQGMRPFVALIAYQYALMLLERRGSGDRDRANCLLDQAASDFAALGMDFMSSRVAGIRSAPRRGRPSSEKTLGLTGRELMVLRLVAKGASNREIAVNLYVTEKTVEHHLTRIYAKLGVSGRAAAGALAAQSGLLD